MTTEASFGGSAGGGKSEALLANALRHVDEAHYRAVLFRRTVPDLKRSLVDRSQGLYRAQGGEYNSTDKVWTFPSGARIAFGSLEHENDIYNYATADLVPRLPGHPVARR